MPVADLKNQILSLTAIQKLDTEIYSLKAEKTAAPERLKTIEAAFEEKKQGLAALEKKLLDFQKTRKDRELELASKEEGVKKLQTQLYSLKTNKEYQTMLQQIADAKADGSVIEDKILLCFEEAEKVSKEIDKEKLRLKEEEMNSTEQKKVISDRSKIIDDRLAQLEAQRSQLVPQINAKIFAQYERILQNREGLAIVPVKDESCSGCNMAVPPQVVNLIKMYDRLVTCEVCNRILCIEENEGN
ncbi:MAG: C4-type zinc ribbon domain-containing protein [Candidatus Omnitrophica bacterium]|nr:C4-type zinc ribbon domain-containing protein [Candidatus Omnitrophota bacterium]